MLDERTKKDKSEKKENKRVDAESGTDKEGRHANCENEAQENPATFTDELLCFRPILDTSEEDRMDIYNNSISGRIHCFVPFAYFLDCIDESRFVQT